MLSDKAILRSVGPVMLSCAFCLPVQADSPQHGCLMVAMDAWNSATGELHAIVTNQCKSAVTAFTLRFACRVSDRSLKKCGKTTFEFWDGIGFERFISAKDAQNVGGIPAGSSSRFSMFIPRNPSVPTQAPPSISSVSYVLYDLGAGGSAEDVSAILRIRAATLRELRYWLGVLSGALERANSQNPEAVEISGLDKQDRTAIYAEGSQKLAARALQRDILSRFPSATMVQPQAMAKRQTVEACLEYIRMRIENGSPHISEEFLQ